MGWAKRFFWWFLGVADTNDVIQKIEKTLNNTHTTTQKLTNNSFRNTKKHPFFFSNDAIKTFKSLTPNHQLLFSSYKNKKRKETLKIVFCKLRIFSVN